MVHTGYAISNGELIVLDLFVSLNYKHMSCFLLYMSVSE